MAEQGPAIADRTPIFALLAAEAVSQVGNMMTVVAGPWFVLQTTGSAAKTGLVGAALVLGSVVPAVVGGPLVDRLGFKRPSEAWATRSPRRHFRRHANRGKPSGAGDSSPPEAAHQAESVKSPRSRHCFGDLWAP